jgi:hypothetical protein
MNLIHSLIESANKNSGDRRETLIHTRILFLIPGSVNSQFEGHNEEFRKKYGGLLNMINPMLQEEHLGESYNPKIIISSIPNLIDNTY